MADPRDLALAAAGTILAAAGAVAWWTQSGPDTPEPAAPSDEPAAAAPATPSATAPAEPAVVPAEPGAPEVVRIPALDVRAPVVPVRAPDRTLIPPQDAQQLGWWADGAKPGAAKGSALITGHTVHTGGGALDDLEELRAGDEVVVRTDRGTLRYEVDRVRTYSKGRISEDAERLFSQDVPGRLVLITCEDWDGTQYLSNVVVTASPG